MNKKVKKFHQFVFLEKGPVNTAIIDLLKGDIFQVENSTIDQYEKGEYETIPEFIKGLKEENLIIEVDSTDWIPRFKRDVKEDEFFKISFELQCESGVDINFLLKKFKDYHISRIVFFGDGIPEIDDPLSPEVVLQDKDFQRCIKDAKVEENLNSIGEAFFHFNQSYNSCWGRKIAVTEDGKVRPCIHSQIVIGDIKKDSSAEIIREVREKYWYLTKDKVNKCKDCELRYACFDCREISQRHGKDLLAANPNCNYDPYKGSWSDRV